MSREEKGPVPPTDVLSPAKADKQECTSAQGLRKGFGLVGAEVVHLCSRAMEAARASAMARALAGASRGCFGVC